VRAPAVGFPAFTPLPVKSFCSGSLRDTQMFSSLVVQWIEMCEAQGLMPLGWLELVNAPHTGGWNHE
jgi:hypothetical protein